MYKLLIAEDEAIIRNGMVRTIPWKEMGFQVCGVAEDGLEALDMARALAPDALVTDIKMPGLSGLDLIHALNGENRTVPAIILTGYADFAYAKRAVEEHAFAYVLKMDVMKELPPALERLRQALDAMRAVDPSGELERMRSDVVSSTRAILDSLRDEPVRKGLEYVLSHFTEHLRMEDVAEMCYMSPAYFSRTFKQKTGEGFSEMVIRLRMQWARSLLESSDIRVADAARAAGYTDLKYFSSQYRRFFGAAPSSGRRGGEGRP